MRRKKKTTIVTVEARERLTIRHGVQQMTAWCEQCGEDVLMITPDEAAARLGADARTVFRGVEAGKFHFCEDTNGRLLVCSESVRTCGN
jgi:predicted site-specific integrase-resolvase